MKLDRRHRWETVEKIVPEGIHYKYECLACGKELSEVITNLQLSWIKEAIRILLKPSAFIKRRKL